MALCGPKLFNLQPHIRPLSQQAFCLVIVQKAHVLQIIFPMATFYSSVPLSHDNVTVSQHEQYNDPETEAAMWNSFIIVIIIYTM